jgi:hypothetical protein
MSRKQHLARQCQLHNKSGNDGHVFWIFNPDGSVSAFGRNTGGYSFREMRRAAKKVERKRSKKGALK